MYGLSVGIGRPARPTDKATPVGADLSLRQRRVNEYFDSVAPYWRDVYRQDGLQGLSYRLRMETALTWIDESQPVAGAAALDVGSGAGLVTVELARRGLHVESIDRSHAMIKLAAETAAESGVGDRVTTRLADVHHLPYPDHSFRVVVALGLLSWLHTPELAVREMARVLAPDGLLVVSADNRARLNWLLEPRENLLLSPIKLARRRVRARRGHQPSGAPARLHLPRQIDRMLVEAGLRPVCRRTVGFGPFTFFDHPILPDRLAFPLHQQLQILADDGTPGLRAMGWHYVVSAMRERRR